MLPDEIGFVLEFAVGMRFPTLTIVVWPNSFSGAAFVAVPRTPAVLVDELDLKGLDGRELRPIKLASFRYLVIVVWLPFHFGR